MASPLAGGQYGSTVVAAWRPVHEVHDGLVFFFFLKWMNVHVGAGDM
jgi:hypothetical protein